jgi:5-formyltetrahydrofolate cyclo-ligase
MTKAELRQLYLEKRRQMLPAEVDAASRAVADRFFDEIDLSAVSNLHTFIRSARANELDTSNIYLRIWRDLPKIATYAPRVDTSSPEMESVRFHSSTELVESRWGIREPMGDDTAEPESFDLVILPLLAFDESGHRVGYGKGYYDRFLSKCRLDCQRVGVCAFPPEQRIDNVGWHDLKLNTCITPMHTYRFE